MLFALFLPFAALIAVAIVAISLGIVFTMAGNVGTSIIGLAIIGIVPAIGFLLTRGGSEAVESETES